MRIFFSRFLRDERAVALIEFVFVSPFLLLLLWGALELNRFILIAQKVDKAVYEIASITSQYTAAAGKTPKAGEISQGSLSSNFARIVPRSMSPYDRPQDFNVMIASLRKEGAETKLKWQMGIGNGTLGVTSHVTGLPPRPPAAAFKDRTVSFPQDANAATAAAALPDQQNIIVAELFYQYQPILQDLLTPFGVTVGQQQLYRSAYLTPRARALICLPPTMIYDKDCPGL